MRSIRNAATALAIPLAAWIACAPSSDLPPLCIDITAPDSNLPALWTQLHPATSPPARVLAASGFDEANDRLIVFGGVGNGPFLGDTWVLSGATDIAGSGTWTGLATTGTAPSARSSASGAYDAANNRFILFGGANAQQTFSDVWVLTNANGLGGTATWTALTPSGQGPAAYGASTVYDATSNTLVVFGGGAGTSVSNDLWTLSNANGMGGTPAWSKVGAGSPPPARQGAPAVLAAGGKMLFFGGDGGGPGAPDTHTLFNDTWSLSPIGSTPLAFAPFVAASPPSARTGQSLAFDGTTQRAILFAGNIPAAYDDAVFLLSAAGGTPWAVYQTGNAPPPRAFHTAAYSAKTNRMVVFGGLTYSNTGDVLADTWVLDHANGTPAAPPVKLTVTSAQSQACAGSKLRVSAEATDAAGNVEGVPVVWTCSDPAAISPDGILDATTPEDVTVTACLPDMSLCSDPLKIHVAAPSGGGSGGSSGGGSGGGSCAGGFMASERSCIDNGGSCDCGTDPCSACIPSAMFPLANGSALGEGQSGCIDTDGSVTGNVGAVIRPCAPGLCCNVGTACGGGGSHCGPCKVACN